MTECFSVAILEAMSSGTAIVASRIGGIQEIIDDGENGMLVPPKDVDSLSNAIIYLLQRERLCKTMGINGRKKVENYSWEKIVSMTEETYKDLDIL
jgi:glycosyltransferase involved in cell wall biosynthesis